MYKDCTDYHITEYVNKNTAWFILTETEDVIQANPSV